MNECFFKLSDVRYSDNSVMFKARNMDYFQKLDVFKSEFIDPVKDLLKNYDRVKLNRSFEKLALKYFPIVCHDTSFIIADNKATMSSINCSDLVLSIRDVDLYPYITLK